MNLTSTPGEAIHRFCVACVGGSPFEVKTCGGEKCLNGGCAPSGECWFYKFRLGRGRPSVKLLRKYCLYCCGGDREYVRECPDGIPHGKQAPCALYPFRMGKNPNFNPAIAENLKQRADSGRFPVSGSMNGTEAVCSIV